MVADFIFARFVTADIDVSFRVLNYVIVPNIIRATYKTKVNNEEILIAIYYINLRH